MSSIPKITVTAFLFLFILKAFSYFLTFTEESVTNPRIEPNRERPSYYFNYFCLWMFMLEKFINKTIILPFKPLFLFRNKTFIPFHSNAFFFDNHERWETPYFGLTFFFSIERYTKWALMKERQRDKAGEERAKQKQILCTFSETN